MLHIERAVIRAGDVAAIADCSFDAAPGEAWALIGDGGCGKGLLVAAIAGAVPLAGGEIVVNGRSQRREPAMARRMCGYVPAALEGWPGIRADEFLDLFATAVGLSGKRLTEARTRALDLAGLSGDARLDHRRSHLLAAPRLRRAHRISAKQDGGAARTLAPLTRISGTDYAGTTVSMAASTVCYVEPVTVSPATSVLYTVSEFNAAEFGYKLIS